MIEINSDNLFKNTNSKTITKVKSIIVTTDVGDIIFSPCEDAVISLVTTQTSNLIDCGTKKEVTIEG